MVLLSLLGAYPLMWRTFLLIYCRVALPVQTPVVELQFDQVLKGLNEHSLIYIDVRNQTEVVSDGRIPGSFVIPVLDIENAFSMSSGNFTLHYGFPKPSKEAGNVVVGCFEGARAEEAIKALREKGYSFFKIYRGSFHDWNEKGGPISHIPHIASSVQAIGT